MRKLALYLTPLALAAAPSLAQGADTIVVTATRTEQPLERVGQAMTVLDRQTLLTLQTPFVADVLQTTPGVSLSRNGGQGGVATIRIRGAESDQTAALIDGVKLNDPAAPGGGFDFANLLVGNIERIEVLRGPQSVLWGSQAIGGVVNMITAKPTDRFTANGRAEYGAFNTAQAVGNVSGRFGPVAASLGAGYYRTDGVSAFNRQRGGREADGYENVGANARLTVDLTDWLGLDLRGFYARGKVDVDGFPPPAFRFADTPETNTSRELVGYAGLNLKLLDGRWTSRIAFAATDKNRRSDDPEIDPTLTFLANGRNARIEAQSVFEATDWLQLTGGFEREISRLRTGFPDFFDPQTLITTRGRQRIASVYGQAVIRPVEVLTLIAGVRHDDHQSFGGETTLGFSGAWSLNEGATRLKASYGEGFKAPSLFQLLSDFGNRALKPETAKAWDVGVEQSLLGRRISASLTYFARTAINQIDFISCFGSANPICVNRPFGTYDNVLRARADGLEATLALRPIAGLEVNAQYSYVNARNRSAGTANANRLLARRPQHTASVRADFTAQAGWGVGATVTHVGNSFDDAGNRRKLDGYTLLDVRASSPVWRGAQLYARVANLTDDRTENVFLYGTPGRAGYVGVKVSF
jgi:vitamin B12 transporter